MATTYTTHYNLPKPGDGDINWGTTYNSGLDLIDTALESKIDSNAYLAGINQGLSSSDSPTFDNITISSVINSTGIVKIANPSSNYGSTSYIICGDEATIDSNGNELAIKQNVYYDGGDKYMKSGQKATQIVMGASGFTIYTTDDTGTAGGAVTNWNIKLNLSTIGSLSVNGYGTTTATTAGLNIDMKNDGAYVVAENTLSAGLTTGHYLIKQFGKADSSKNATNWRFQYTGSGSDSNYASFGFHGVDNIIKYYPTGSVVLSGSIDCGSSCEANAYTVGGTAGVDFSGAVTNITVVKGIVTAVS